MTYKDKLNPWCIIRSVSNVQMRNLDKTLGATLEETRASRSGNQFLIRRM
ncbi:hypothetical protein H6F98_19720 [Microcoleus sp. FACHB-SPT15]|nr:hypothetical protein [Microcoleus sp. FACHB-SPT15]MBD1807656.1 hypothetical protein [Microcoleus sp. FACHB-SPT15]